jgi:formylglycine-generating enzyme required for sulfatase activity
VSRRLPSGYEYRLPTEAEWEYAACGGNKSRNYKYSGSNGLNEVAWYDENSKRKTHEVGIKKANELGIYDMSGNVWEWCLDWHETYPGGNVRNPQGTLSGSCCVFRGGSWGSSASRCRVAFRNNNSPVLTHHNLGFRAAIAPVQR